MTKKKNDTDFTITLPKEKKPSRKKGQKSYTTQEVQEVLVILEGNNGNLSKSSRDTGIPLSTIKTWREKNKVEDYSDQRDQSRKEVAKSRKNAEDAWNDMVLYHLPKFDESIQESLKRVIDLIKVEKDIDKISKYMETIGKIMPKPIGEAPVVNNIQQYIQNQQNNYDNELS